MEGNNSTAPRFPLARFTYTSENLLFYYTFGNTQAEDLLKSCVEAAEPHILSLGCGDIRSCFYTVWKHFSVISNAPRQFSGVHFVLNDLSSAVLARNILFILLCYQLPQSYERRKEWLCAMWGVWYCHELYPQHQRILNNGLKLLLEYSESCESWEHAANPLHALVKFTSPIVLAKVSEKWRMWLEGKVSVKQMHASKEKLIKEFWARYVGNTDSFAAQCANDLTNNIGHFSVSSKIDKCTAEVASYFKNGNCHAEALFQSNSSSSTSVNLTFYESSNWKFTKSLTCLPFNGYFHTVQFTSTTLPSAGMDESLNDSMMVRSERFDVHPLLANSFNQFSMWTQTCSEVLSDNKNAITFVFNNMDALEFCQLLQCSDEIGKRKFDAIFSSNLMDYLGALNIVLSVLPLLEQHAFLFTQTMLYNYSSMSSLSEFLDTTLGFDCKFLPVFLGVRCLNHEGEGYSSLLTVEPIPVFTRVQTLIWKRELAPPMVVDRLPPPEYGNVTWGLVKFFIAMAHSLTQKTLNEDNVNLVCCHNIEMAIALLQHFCASYSDYHFYDSFSFAVQKELKPFLECFQTQAFLHGLHIHFTVDENNCPMCLHTPIEESIALFEMKLPLTDRCYSNTSFQAIIHPYSSLDAQDGKGLGLYFRDLQVFDCITGAVREKTANLKFFAPKSLLVRNLNVTMASCALSSRGSKKVSIGICPLLTARLNDLVVQFEDYLFFHPTDSHSGSENLTSNVYTQDGVVSEIPLSDSMLDGLALSDLKISKVSSSEVKLLCGSHEFNLQFLFPVNYNSIKVKFSRTQKNVKVICSRQAHTFEEEPPVFIAYPDHKLSLFPERISSEQVTIHSFLQLMNTTSVGSSEHLLLPQMTFDPLAKVKNTISTFFEAKNSSVVLLKAGCKSGYVYINKIVFDYEHRAPALDLAFCFPEDHSHLNDLKRIEKVTCSKKLSLESAVFDDLKKVLLYFARRTNGDCKSAGVDSIYHCLVQQEVDQYFVRAVLFFLYNDSSRKAPDELPSNSQIKFSQKTVSPSEFSQALESGLPPISGNLPQASASTCSLPQANTTGCLPQANTTSCSFCNKAGNLKTCKQCGKARYCDRECQSKHWPQHKVACRKFAKAKN